MGGEVENGCDLREKRPRSIKERGLMSALSAQESLAACGRRFFLFVLVDSGFSRNQKGISPSADGDPGLCPENPQTFEKV